MLAIRFLRIGKKNSPSFRLVVTEKTAPPKGKFLEVVGFYNPGTKDWGLKNERATYWIQHGAQPSDTAHNFLVKHGALKSSKIAVHAKSKREAEKEHTHAVAGTPQAQVEGSVSTESAASVEESATTQTT